VDRRNVLRAILLVLLILFASGFWGEIVVFLRWYIFEYSPMPDGVAHAFATIRINLLYFILMYLFWLWTAAGQAIFPVRALRDVILTALYLFLYCLGWHGVAAYVRNGRIKAYVEELTLQRPGALAVDFNSAIAVEQIVTGPGLLRTGLLRLLRRVLASFGANPPAIRVQGAGLVFTLPDERIHGVNDLEAHPVISEDQTWMERILGVVDLRNQFRISGRQPHKLSKRLRTSVLAYTRDGIEVQTNIWVLATIGQDPVPHFPLNVTYVGDPHPRNLRVVALRGLSERASLLRVESLTDELDPRDQVEIHELWQATSNWMPFQNPPRPLPITPVFNAERVFAAIYARARHHRGLGGADEIIPWIDLPIHVAVDFFREIISHYNYDEIYRTDENGRMRIRDVRSKLGSAVRNSGLLAVRPVFHRSGNPLEVGTRYLANDLLTVPAADAFVLRTPQLLRDRGIRIIASGFGDLVVDERIYKQRLDNWKAAWDQETEIVEAGLEWESVRVHTRARIRAQQEFVQRLAQIYQSNANSREILALRVLQALEGAAADPKTRQLLPEDTFSMLRSIHDWLLPQDMGYGSDS
jgi:hypothetical protein